MVYMGDKVNKQVRYFQINIIGILSRGAGRMAVSGEMSVSAEDLSSVAFEKCLTTKRM